MTIVAAIGHWALSGGSRSVSGPSPADWDIGRLEMPAACNRALRNLGVRTLGDLSRKTEKELRRLHRIGPVTVRRIQERLERLGLGLAKGWPDW